MLTTLAQKVDPALAAVLVIDMQNDFCHTDGAAGKNGSNLAMVQSMAPTLARFIDAARVAGTPVIFVRTFHGPDSDSEAWLERRRQRSNTEFVNCVEGTWGADWYGVAPVAGEDVVIKHRWSAFVRSELEELLQRRGIKSLILTGTATNGCVEATARDGFMLDFYSVLVSDCTAAASPERHWAALEGMRAVGVTAPSQEIMACWPAISIKV
jgi:ureidoacrylate peracid hydrolase